MKTRLNSQLVLRTDTAGWSVIYAIPILCEYFFLFPYVSDIRKYISGLWHGEKCVEI